MIDLMKRLAELDAQNPNMVKEQGMAEGSGPREKQHDKYVDRSGPESKAKVQAAKDKMASDKAAEPGKKLADKIAKKDVKEGSAPEIDAQATSQYAQKILDALGKEYGRSYFDYRYNKDDSIEIWTKSTNINPDSVITPYYNLFRDKGWHFSQPVGGKFTIAVEKPKQQTGGLAWRDQMEESLEECGMMGGMSSQPHSPASINMTAATGEELSGMLKDIMQLAGRPMQEPMDVPDEMDGEEPLGGADGVAVVDVEPSPDVGADSHGPSIMRSMLDKMNPETDDADDQEDDEEEKVDEYDNTPNPKVSGYDAAVPSGNDLHKEKSQYPAAQRGDNPMAATFESLMAEYKNFISESSKEAHEQNMDAAQREMDSREAEGEDMSNHVIDPKTYKIVKKK